MRRKHKLAIPIVLAAVIAVVAGLATALEEIETSPKDSVPTTRVRRGNLDTKVYTRGELRPGQSAMLAAPSVGGNLQIIHVAPTGTRVKKDDVVIQFDPSEQEYSLAQAKSDLAQADQEIIKAKADAAVQVATDKVDLLKAKYAVRQAELEVSKNELVSAIDAKKNLLSLEEAKRHLAQLEQDVKSRAASNSAAIALSEEKRNKARIAMQQAEDNIEKITMRSPMDGLVSVKENYDYMGGMIIGGVPIPEYRDGDQVSPGRVVAQILNTNEMEIQAKVEEVDRANINPGQAVEVHVDALPGVTYAGKVKTVAGMASNNFWGGDSVRKFDATFQLLHPDNRLRPGVTAEVVIVGDQAKGVLYVPPQAIFEKDGKPIVYIKTGGRFEPKDVSIVRRTEGHIIIQGVSAGTEVTLVNPEQQNKKVRKPTGPLSPAVAGGGQ